MRFSHMLVSLTLLFTTPFFYASSTSANETADFTVLVYMNGSDLESEGGAATSDLMEMMAVGSNSRVNVVVETGGTKKWQNEVVKSTSNQRWLVQKDGIQLVNDVGNRNMGESGTLSDFIAWGKTAFPAKKYALIMWDHGAGSVHGFGADENHDKDSLTLDEMAKSFADAYAKTNTSFELIGFDACLMANLETANVAQPYAHYFVASEELEPGHGWNYTPVLAQLTANPSITGDKLGKVIADSYREQAKAEGTDDSITLSVIDLTKIKPVVAAFDELVKGIEPDISNVEQLQWVANARYKSEDYGSAGAHGGNTDMTDLSHFVKQLEPKYAAQATKLTQALNQSVVYSINSPAKPNTKGLSIYFPSKDRENFKDNLAVYNQVQFSENYKQFLSSYVNSILGDATPVTFTENMPEASTIETETGAEETVYEVTIDPKEASAISELYSVLGVYAPDSESKIHFLGVDNYDVELDSKTGSIKGYFAGQWATLGGQFVSMYVSDENEQFTQYAVPVKLNGVEMDIMVLFNKETGESNILGGWQGIDDESGIADKDLIQIKPGDKIIPLYDFIDVDTDAEGYEEGEEFTVGEELAMEYQPLPVGDYLYGFYTIDYAQNENFSDFTVITIEE